MRGFGVIALKRGESDVVAIRKAIIELERRGIRIVWNTKPKDILD